MADNVHYQQHVFYTYTLDLSALSPAANHCVKLLIHFGPPLGCAYNVLVLTNGTASVGVSSATLAPYGDINFLFGSDCLLPGQLATRLGMLSDTQPRTNYLTIIDDYTDPASGQTNETRVNVSAIVPDIPPNWAYAPFPIPNPFFQGNLVLTNQNTPFTNISGAYDFTFQLVDGVSNGLPVSQVVTQTAQVVNGLFNTPLPFDPGIFMGDPLWLSMSVKPPNGPGFTPLNPPLAITPTPQAIYAYSAGVVADLSPGQAVTSLDGLTGGVTLQAGSGILLGTNGNTLTITAQPGVVSDRNLKTGFLTVKPEDILARLVALPIQSWRFTNEVANVRHLGPTAQDFKMTFGLGTSDTTIGIVDEGGVALSAIQGLNQKLEAQVKAKDAEIEALKLRLEKLERTVGQQNVNH